MAFDFLRTWVKKENKLGKWEQNNILGYSQKLLDYTNHISTKQVLFQIIDH